MTRQTALSQCNPLNEYYEESVSVRTDEYMDEKPQAAEDPFGPLTVAIAAQLREHRPTAGRQDQLANSLMDRVRLSAQAHRPFVTVRRDRGEYEPIARGVSLRALRHDSAVRVDLMCLEPHTPVYWPDAVHAQEILVLAGSVSDGASLSLSRHELTVRDNCKLVLNAGDQGATLYLRQLKDPVLLPALEAQWWSHCDTVDDHTWDVAVDGVEVRVLRGHGDVVSMLVRIAPGATVPQHAHNLDEDCMMLSGDFFSGDILLRPEDYQLVPKDVHHNDCFSDTGALLYVHGVMPEIA